MVDGSDVFIDADFAGHPLQATPYLTKFARNKRSALDNSILRAEGVFYRALTALLAGTGIETIDTSQMMTHHHQNQVSLWLPRFDVGVENNRATRYGLESVYSIINAAPGSYKDHFEVIDKVWGRIKTATQMSSFEFARQYLIRDLLNLVFGNSDNHGRNMSFLKLENDIQFAPIYDFAPMKADPEMVTRLFKWGRECERSGLVQFNRVAEHLAEFADPALLLGSLREIAERLLDLPGLLQALDCPQEILEFPAIAFESTKDKLISYGVYHE